MDEAVKKILAEEEVLAIEILENAGWILHHEIFVDRAAGPGHKWPSYTLGGEYRFGILRKSIDASSSGSPPAKKKRGGPKKIAA